MAIAGKKTDPVRLFFRRLGMLALVVLLIVALSALWDVYKKERESRLLRTQAEREMNELAAQESRLSAELARLQTKRGKEEVLREHYQMGRPGEKMIVIVEPPAPEPVQATTTPFKKWMHTFLPFW